MGEGKYIDENERELERARKLSFVGRKRAQKVERALVRTDEHNKSSSSSLAGDSRRRRHPIMEIT